MTMAKDKTHDPAFEIGFFESVLRRDPNYSEVIEILGGLYTKMGRISDGLRMDRRLVRLQPGNHTAHYNLACSLALCRRKAEALRLAQAGGRARLPRLRLDGPGSRISKA